MKLELDRLDMLSEEWLKSEGLGLGSSQVTFAHFKPAIQTAMMYVWDAGGSVLFWEFDRRSYNRILRPNN